MRIEKDFIGSLHLPANALYGIHSLRATDNFPDTTSFPEEWYRAMAMVKQACYITVREFYTQLQKKHTSLDSSLRMIPEDILKAMMNTSEEMSCGKYFEHFIVPAISGGAGTSINMNVNEIIANCSLIAIGNKPGNYQVIDPVEHANIYQSTNDVVPTALKVSILFLLQDLEKSINLLRAEVEQLEKKSQGILRIAYTQMQAAVPSSYGRLFGNYCEALSRDWWRISKCGERIKTINLGGSAIGTGITVPRFFMMEVVQSLQIITGLPISKAENRCDNTSNLDALVEVHGILKAHAVNLEKMASDIRLLSSDLAQTKELEIPAKQVGSSIMPGKVNPVIAEFIISVSHKIYANDILITALSAQGVLDLNAYLPVIGNALIESLRLLIAANQTALTNFISGIKINDGVAYEQLMKSPAITTALIPYIGYNNANILADEMKQSNGNIFQANAKHNLVDRLKLEQILQTHNLLKEGFSVNDINGL